MANGKCAPMLNLLQSCKIGEKLVFYVLDDVFSSSATLFLLLPFIRRLPAPLLPLSGSWMPHPPYVHIWNETGIRLRLEHLISTGLSLLIDSFYWSQKRRNLSKSFSREIPSSSCTDLIVFCKIEPSWAALLRLKLTYPLRFSSD